MSVRVYYNKEVEQSGRVLYEKLVNPKSGKNTSVDFCAFHLRNTEVRRKLNAQWKVVLNLRKSHYNYRSLTHRKHCENAERKLLTRNGNV